MPPVNTLLLRIFGIVIFVASLASAQEVIPLYQSTPPGSAPESYAEKQYFSKSWGSEVVTNVTKPTLVIFRPAPETKNGTAVVICPGGGLMALQIDGKPALI